MKKSMSYKQQQGLVLVFSILVLLVLTVLGVGAVSSGLMQTKMTINQDMSNIAFQAAESALEAVVFESEDPTVVNIAATDPLALARQGTQLDRAIQSVSCYDSGTWVDRKLTSDGLQQGVSHTASGDYVSTPSVSSWSKTAFLQETHCLGSSNVIGGTSVSCHVFVSKGCGQVTDSNFAIANTQIMAVMAPASN